MGYEPHALKVATHGSGSQDNFKALKHLLPRLLS